LLRKSTNEVPERFEQVFGSGKCSLYLSTYSGSGYSFDLSYGLRREMLAMGKYFKKVSDNSVSEFLSNISSSGSLREMSRQIMEFGSKSF
jgi:hypothetical protein